MTDVTVPYATPMTAHRPAGRGWLATAILVGGLGLVFLAGCFLIGVMSVVSPSGFGVPAQPRPLTSGQTAFVLILYFFAFSCLGGAAALIVIAVRQLLRLING
jgi:hypothetical protein